LVISWVWVWNDEIIPLLLAWSKEHIELMIIALSEPLPQSIQWIANAAGLFFLVSLPVWLLHLRLSRTVMTKAQANLVSHIYFFLWLFFSLIILV
jgi:DNA-binding transcriptional MocR family regulator